MTIRDPLDKVLEELPDDRLNEVLDFVKSLTAQREQDQWRRAAKDKFAEAYGSDEPEYTITDIKPELNR